MPLQQDELEISRRNTETFRRIRLLFQKGYKLESETPIDEDNQTMWLKHPGKGPKRIFIFSNGTVGSGDEELNPKDVVRGTYRIFNESEQDCDVFDRWIRRVPVPNWRERTSYDREKYLWQPLIAIALYTVILGVSVWITNVLGLSGRE